MKPLEYKDFRGITFVFVGENATTGEPNKNTGRMSKYGRIYQTRNKENAKEFASLTSYKNPGKIVEIGTIKDMRRFCLGNSMRYFLLDCMYCPTIELYFSEIGYDFT